MGVKLGAKKLASGKTSLFIDYNYKGNRKKEYIGIVLDSPTTPEIRAKNKEKRRLAESIRAKRELEIVSVDYEVSDIRMRTNTDFLTYYENFTKSYNKKDIRLVEASLRYFKEFIGKKSLSAKELTEDLCNAFYDDLTDKLNASTPANYFKKFKMVLKKAVKDKLFKESPAKDIKIVTSEEVTKDILTFDEIQRLAETPCPNSEVKRAFLFMLNTGLRWCDTLNLQFKDIDFKASRLVITQLKVKKSSKNATLYIDLNPTALKLLEIKKGEPEDKVFNLPSHTGGLKDLRSWVNKAGITKHITFHCARHSFITNVLSNGANIKTASALAGHSSTRHTEKYTHIVDELKKRAVYSLPDINVEF